MRISAPSDSPARATRLAALWHWGGLALALALGGWLRWTGVYAAYPYLNYIDEGHILHPVRETLATGAWDPAHNGHPQLPGRTIAGLARALSPWAGDWAIAPTVADTVAQVDFYDRVDPPELILVGRLLSWTLALGIIALAATLAGRLAGAGAGVVAGFAAALLPALVLRGAAVAVDPYATLFVLAAFAVVASQRGERLFSRAALAGACCGCAAISKYPSGLALLGVAATLALTAAPSRARLLQLLCALAGAVAAAAILMPSTWQQPAAVWRQLTWQGSIYASLSSPTLWQQAFSKAEWDLAPVDTPELGAVFMIVAVAGLAALLRRPDARPLAVGVLLFGVALVGLHSRYSFQAFRNLLPLAALTTVAFAAAIATLGKRLRRPALTALAGIALLFVLFLPAGLAYRRDRLGLVDSRRQAIDWLLEHRRARQPLLLLAEAAIPRREVERLPGAVSTLPWPAARDQLMGARPRFALLADLSTEARPLIPDEDRPWLLERYRVRATFGEQASDAGVFAWRGNRLRVWILERRKRAPEPR